MEQNDQRLTYEIERAIGQIPGVYLGNLRVSVKDGYARIQGVVPTLEHKTLATEAAMQIPGVFGVDEGIAVETTHVPRDQDLNQEIGAALDEEEDVDALRVGAAVHCGTAILAGHPQSVRELGRAAETTGSVPGTINTLDTTRIQNPYGADQEDLANAVADVLRRHPVLHSRSIRPLLEATGKVVLVGTVHSDDERLLALEAASGVPGIHSIREELEVVP